MLAPRQACGSMWLLASLFVISTRAFIPTAPKIIRFESSSMPGTGTPCRSFLVAPRHDARAVPNMAIAYPRDLTIVDKDRQGVSHTDLQFTANSDNTISSRLGGCMEAHGDRVRINRCSGQPTQKWNVLQRAHGPQTRIQLQGSNKCLFVDPETEGALNGAPIELRQCENTIGELWNFEDPISLPVSSASASLHVAISWIAVTMIGALSLAAGLRWRRKKNSEVSPHQSGIVMTEGGVSLATPMVMHQSRNAQQITPAVMATAPQEFVEACKKGDMEAVEKFLNEEIPIDDLDGRGITPLGSATAMNQKPVVQLLLDRKANPALVDRGGNSALHYAAGYGHKEIMELLVESGVDVDKANQVGQTPLVAAAMNQQPEDVIQVLTDAGADLKAAMAVMKTLKEQQAAAREEQEKRVAAKQAFEQEKRKEEEERLQRENIKVKIRAPEPEFKVKVRKKSESE